MFIRAPLNKKMDAPLSCANRRQSNGRVAEAEGERARLGNDCLRESVRGSRAAIRLGRQHDPDNQLLTGELAIAVYWWLWFRRVSADEERRTREILVVSVIGVGAAVVLSIVLAPLFSAHGRPIHEPG